ncbi:hypothetical protein CMEL01_02156 [Colletotrichum melonis]|uniref:Uncharacterized protein n=1 Tax=Colletotrichum melonis TaxID=1209925 RepID=A0AAI9XPZ1_9PEZI|nr:hypothetical protein CMEL01_02156 [Colletotrichum melonis]
MNGPRYDAGTHDAKNLRSADGVAGTPNRTAKTVPTNTCRVYPTHSRARHPLQRRRPASTAPIPQPSQLRRTVGRPKVPLMRPDFRTHCDLNFYRRTTGGYMPRRTRPADPTNRLPSPSRAAPPIQVSQWRWALHGQHPLLGGNPIAPKPLGAISTYILFPF